MSRPPGGRAGHGKRSTTHIDAFFREQTTLPVEGKSPYFQSAVKENNPHVPFYKTIPPYLVYKNPGRRNPCTKNLWINDPWTVKTRVREKPVYGKTYGQKTSTGCCNPPSGEVDRGVRSARAHARAPHCQCNVTASQ